MSIRLAYWSVERWFLSTASKAGVKVGVIVSVSRVHAVTSELPEPHRGKIRFTTANSMFPVAGIPDWKLSETEGWSPEVNAWKP